MASGKIEIQEVDYNQHTESVDLYLHIDNALPSITVNASIDDESIVVDSIADISAGDVIVLYEDDRFFQSLVVSATGNTITLGSPLDYAFTTSATVHVGDWNLAVDGSLLVKTAHLIAPPNAIIDIHTINISMVDNATMDGTTFGGIPALGNGILFRLENGIIKNLPLVVNNLGFAETGCVVNYDDKVPAGTYGFRARKNYLKTNGTVLRVDGSAGDELQLLIRDDLTDLTNFNVTINGHIVEE